SPCHPLAQIPPCAGINRKLTDHFPVCDVPDFQTARANDGQLVVAAKRAGQEFRIPRTSPRLPQAFDLEEVVSRLQVGNRDARFVVALPMRRGQNFPGRRVPKIMPELPFEWQRTERLECGDAQANDAVSIRTAQLSTIR